MTTTPTLWGFNRVLTSDTTSNGARVTALADDSFAFVWENGSKNIFGAHFDLLSNGGASDFLSQLSAAQTKEITRPHIIQQADGQVFVDFQQLATASEADILRNTLNGFFVPNASATPLENSSTDEFILDTTARSNGVGDFGSAVVYNIPVPGADPGNLVALRFVTAAGQPTGGQIIVGAHDGETQENAALAGRHTGHVVVAYENFNFATNQRDIRVHSYAPDGSDTAGEVFASTTDAGAGFPDVTALRDGTFVVAWQEAGGIAFRRFFAEATPTDAQPTLIPGSAGSFVPKVTALKDGGFIVAWTTIDGKESDNSPDLDVVLQRFDKVGVAVGDKLLFDQPGDQGLFNLDLATLADGRVVVSFQSETGNATNVSIQRFQIVDPRDNAINGDFASNTIVGREDATTIFGLDGNDTLIGRAAADRLDGGNDRDNLGGGAGNDTLIGGADMDTLGGGVNNDLLAGGAADDELSGATGNDVLSGAAGADRLNGGQGIDRLLGGLGRDTMTGAAGSDTFVFVSVAESSPAPQGRDLIQDFAHLVDHLDLSAIDAVSGPGNQAFVFKGTGNFNGAGQIRVQQSGDDTIVFANTIGAKLPEMSFTLHDVTAASLTAGDFIL